ncbi:MAG: recombinase family protein [Verrucomicrobiia bacterium]
MKAAIYMRVSTDDQDTEHQRAELVEFCTRRGWEPVEFRDVMSGASWKREGLDRMMEGIRSGALKAVLCVKLDRLGRSLVHLAQMVGEFTDRGVALVVPGQGIDTSSGNAAGKLQMHVLMAIAEFERTMIQDRTRAGLATARARGKRLGRPPVLDPVKISEARELLLLEPAMSAKVLGGKIGVSEGTAFKVRKMLREGRAG